jgi:hypothetical protein
LTNACCSDSLPHRFAGARHAWKVETVVIVGAAVLVPGPYLGEFIINPLNAAAQGIAVEENLYIVMTGKSKKAGGAR